MNGKKLIICAVALVCAGIVVALVANKEIVKPAGSHKGGFGDVSKNPPSLTTGSHNVQVGFGDVSKNPPSLTTGSHNVQVPLFSAGIAVPANPREWSDFINGWTKLRPEFTIKYPVTPQVMQRAFAEVPRLQHSLIEYFEMANLATECIRPAINGTQHNALSIGLGVEADSCEIAIKPSGL